MRRFLVALGGTIVLGAILTWPIGPAAATPANPAITNVVPPGSVSSPGGLAVDADGQLFIADTDHCRVLLVPNGPGKEYGQLVQAHHRYVIAGSHCGATGGIGYPTGVAVDQHGDVFIAEASAQRVLMVRPSGTKAVSTVAGTGQGGFNGDGHPAQQGELDQPTGVAVDSAGNLFIADTANCRVRMVPAVSGTFFSQQMVAGHLYTVTGTGVCGTADRSGPAGLAQLWNPVAVAVDQFDDLYVADNGDQSVLEVPRHGGFYYGTVIGGGDLAVIIGMEGLGNTPYLVDGLSATSSVAELNDPEGIAVEPDGLLVVTDGSQHTIRVVPATSTSVFGRAMAAGNMYTLAGYLPITVNAAAPGDGTRWILTKMGIPTGVAVSPSGAVYFSDRGTDQVRKIG